MEPKTPAEFDAALVAFVAAAQKLVDEHRNRHYPGNPTQTISTMEGPKYVRVVIADSVHRSAYVFVERATGAILKPDGWKRPAKGWRGNIYSDDPTSAVTPYGAKYAR